METRYIHTTDVHNLEAPSFIVPMLIDLFNPQSVIDFGCGIGTFLNVFLQNGINDIVGLDGNWVDQKLLEANIPSGLFQPVNLEDDINLGRRFDLAICLEVAEHLPQNKAETFVNNLVNASDLIVFSAAIPYQGGQNHINEQWPNYWQDLFENRGYRMFDVIRYRLWDNPQVFFWYKQNIFVFAKKESATEKIVSSIPPKPNTIIQGIVHPDMYYTKIEALANAQEEIVKKDMEIEKLMMGGRGGRLYLTMIKRYLLRKMHITQ